MAHNDIKKSTESTCTYTVKSRTCSIEYEMDTESWSCTCSVGRTGQPSGEPCKHQHAAVNKYNLTAPKVVLYLEDTYMLKLHLELRKLGIDHILLWHNRIGCMYFYC